MGQSIDLGNTDSVLFNNLETEILQLNGITIWESLKNIVEAPAYLHLSGIDENGHLEGSWFYNGTPVEYAVGKWTFTIEKYYISSLPTTQDEYVGKYYKNINENATSAYQYTDFIQMVSITADNIETLITDGTIVVGETLAYEEATDTSQAVTVLEKITWAEGNGYNARYFGLDRDFFPSPDPDVTPTQYIDSHLIIPNRYNGKKVTRVLRSAFDGYDLGDANTKKHYGQCYYIGSIEFAKGIKTIDDYSFWAPALSGEIILPEGLETLRTQVFRSVSKLDIPTSIKAIGKAYKFGGTNASRSGICVYRAKNADTTIGQYQFGGGSVLYGVFAQWSTIIFESSVESMPSGGFSTTYDTTMPILVFKHGADQDITLNFPSFKSAITVTIYTDCNAVINYDWSAVNITPTIYPLSDYVEG